LIDDAGVDARLLCDTWHFIRSGCSPGDLRDVDAGLIGYVQVNDGAGHIPPEDMIPEAMCERLYPGDGEFPLAELLSFAPRDVPWGTETPSIRRANAGLSASDQAHEAMAAMQRLLILV
jgi:sugar phosphate isomerase/epimerase